MIKLINILLLFIKNNIDKFFFSLFGFEFATLNYILLIYCLLLCLKIQIEKYKNSIN